MSTIERLKELEAKAMHAASRDYQYSGYEQLAELRDLVPLLCDEIHKLLAVVEAAEYAKGTIQQLLDNGVSIGTELACAADLLRRSLAELNENSVPK